MMAGTGRGHHLMTICNFTRKAANGVRGWTNSFRSLLRKHGIKKSWFDLNAIENRIMNAEWLAKHHTNKGPHSQRYHQWVFKRITDALHGLKGLEALEALKKVLKEVADELMAHPELLRQ